MSVQNNMADQRLAALRLIVCKVATTAQQVVNSTSLTDSTALQIYLEPGIYFFETYTAVGSSAYATAGSREALVFTGTATFNGLWYRDTVTNISGSNGSLTFVTAAVTADFDAPALSQLSSRRGIIGVTAAGTLKIQFAQFVAVASQSVTLKIGSQMRVERILS